MSILGYQITLQGLPLPLVAVLAVLSVIVVVKYAKYLSAVGFSSPWRPLVIRVVSMLLLLFCVAGPVVFFVEKIPADRNIVILLDASQSMGMTDSTPGTRWEHALADLKKLTDELPGVETISAFGSENIGIAEVSQVSGMSPFEKETSLSGAMKNVHSFSAEPVSDIIVLTDGRDTTGVSGIANAGGARVHVMGYGTTDPQANTGVMSVVAPEYGFTGEPLVVTGDIYAENLPAGAKIGVELFEGDTMVAGQVVEAETGADLMAGYRLSYKPPEPGLRALRLRVKSDIAENVKDDNERTVFVDIVSGKRALLLIGSPGWEYRFVKEFLLGIEKLKTEIVLLGPEKVFEGADIKRKLADPAYLSQYRTIVAPGAGYLASSEKKALLEYVRGGGGMFVMGGEGSLAASPGPWSAELGIISTKAAGGPEGFEVAPTEKGWKSELLRLGQSVEENKDIWNTLPFVQTFYKMSPKGDAEILATHPWEKCGGNLCPLIFTASEGKGRLVVFSFQGAWRWRFVEKGPENYSRLMTGVLDYLLESKKVESVRLQASADTLLLSESVDLSVIIAPELIEKGVTPIIEIKQPGNGEMITLKPEAGENNAFAISFSPKKVGLYSMKAIAGEKSSQDVPLAVQVSPVEFRHISQNRELLQSAATSTGGTYAEGKNRVAAISDAMKNNTVYGTIRKSYRPWADYRLLLVIAALLTLEWIIRRRGGLT